MRDVLDDEKFSRQELRDCVRPCLQVQGQRRAVVDAQDLRLDPVHDAGLIVVFVEVRYVLVVENLLKTIRKVLRINPKNLDSTPGIFMPYFSF